MRFILKKACFLVILALVTTGCNRQVTPRQLLTENPKKRGEALAKLIKLPRRDVKKLVPPLVKALSDTDTLKTNRAVDALSIIGEPAVPELKKSLEDKDPFVRITAAQTLGLLGRSANVAIPDLIQLLSDSHPLVRDEAAQSLGYIGPIAKDALPSLKKLLKDPNEMVRLNAKEAIKRISEDSTSPKTAKSS